MSSAFKPRVVSGIKKRNYEYKWKIENFYEVQQSEEQVNSQQFRITTDILSDFETRWTVGLKVKKFGHGFGRSYIHPYWKLTYAGSGFQYFDENAVPVITEVSIVDRNGQKLCSNLKRFSGIRNQIIMGDSLLIHNDQLCNLNKLEDENGTLTINISLTLLIPVTFLRPRYQSL